jgi:predicted SPOUT superfamily RNA methylase MTH1
MPRAMKMRLDQEHVQKYWGMPLEGRYKCLSQVLLGKQTKGYQVEAEKMFKNVIRMRFRLILEVQFAIGNAEMKVMRSHLVGKTQEEAMMLANEESNQKFWNPHSNCPVYCTYGQ